MMFTSIPNLPVLNFPRIPGYPDEEVLFPERATLRGLIDRHGHDLAFCNKHSAFITDCAEAYGYWLPRYRAGHPKPGLQARVPEQIGWTAFLYLKAVRALELPEACFWGVMLESLYTHYNEQVLGSMATDKGAIPAPFCSPRKLLETTKSRPRYKHGSDAKKLREHLREKQNITGFDDSMRLESFELYHSLWQRVKYSHSPAVRAIWDEYQDYQVMLLGDCRNRPAGPKVTVCPYCAKRFEWTPGKGFQKPPSTCKNSNCVRKHDRHRKETTRNEEALSQPRKSDWKKGGNGRRGTCRVCSKRKLIDIHRRCFDCDNRA
jgi:hypothetical protein